ncbi:MAG: biotin--[acetyl-CoA-carboxylase] ligase [Candidatus Cloacimonadales bacterium]|jgi:BirA family biotin operon repressor/biotin-[acetyl-CoA-carboxylase] ligase|nr:biotin--[acetyl-CoA-carboxylase] ligase [Candidatus Cloacimonadales bacterium]
MSNLLIKNIPFVHSIYSYSEVGSTMDMAEEIIKEKDLKNNFLVVAETQTKGRGRKGNVWTSNYGGLWFTLALYNYSLASSLMLYTGLMMLRTLKSLFLLDDLSIKWPNDILIGTSKCCGIIANYNALLKYHSIGIGLNTNNKISEINNNYKAISLSEMIGMTVSSQLILEQFLERFFGNIDMYQKDNLEPFLNEFNANHILDNKYVEVINNNNKYMGKCRGINSDGGLLIENNKLLTLYSGTITLFS